MAPTALASPPAAAAAGSATPPATSPATPATKSAPPPKGPPRNPPKAPANGPRPKPPARGRSGSGRRSSGGRVRSVAAQGGSLTLGLIAYAIGVNYIRYGWPGVKGWLRAKFLNQPTQTGGQVVFASYNTGTTAPKPSSSGQVFA